MHIIEFAFMLGFLLNKIFVNATINNLNLFYQIMNIYGDSGWSIATTRNTKLIASMHYQKLKP